MSDAAALLQEAFAAYRGDDLATTERLCRDVIAADPRGCDAYQLLAVTQVRLGRPDEALANCDRALALRQGDPLALSNRAVALDALGRYEEAAASCDQALARQPDAAPTWCNRGNALRALQRFDDAIASYDRALALQPEFADCRYNRALLLLLRGAFAEGWREYEWRRRLATWTTRRFGGPEWRGEDLSGKRLLLYGEGGLGDTIQFARFVALLAVRGGASGGGADAIIVEVEPPLARVLQSLVGAAHLVPHGESLPEFDCHLPLASLPFVLGIDAAQIPASVPYLAAEPERVAAWSKRLPEAPFRVGVAWRGGPRRGSDRGRPIPPAAFEQLGQIPGVRLIGLEASAGQEASLMASVGVAVADPGIDLTTGPDGFLDLAAVMMNLDLIVASDGVIAHLAGALGRPVWVLLKDVPDWRWLLDRTDSPWYPTALLFRQRRRDDWEGLLAQAAGALAPLVARTTGRPTAGSVAGGAAAEAMAAYVINLARRSDRRERFFRWNGGKGLDIAVFDAIDGQTLSKRELLRSRLIDDENLNFPKGHLGNALSHRALWQKCEALRRPILVFEDDAFLSETLRDLIPRIEDELANGCDILYLGYNRDAVLSVGFGGGDWCNIVFETPKAAFEYHAREHGWWSRRNLHCVLDTRLVWGIAAYAVSPSGARSLLRACFPLSNKHPVRMFGSGGMLVPFSMDGAINVAVQRGLVKARVVFPPAVVGPNDLADSDTNAAQTEARHGPPRPAAPR